MVRTAPPSMRSAPPSAHRPAARLISKLGPDPQRGVHFSEICDDRLRRDPAGLRIVGWNVLDRHLKRCCIGLDFDSMHVSRQARIGPDFNSSEIWTQPGQRERGRHIEIGRKTDCRLAGGAGKDPDRFLYAVDVYSIVDKVWSAGQ